ncbi:MAG: hypothetical protein KBB57_09900 [Amaricoccus sp.]|nr:hypothetical protein [Amaricoccus sp.]
MDTPARVTAMLGPTNTGKTHYAIERMLAHRTGVIGLPLRLLAREVYDRLVELRGPSVVALVTGEERIVPARAAYWVCTVEAMPVDILPEFLAVDEIQLCGDPDRGHVFTDRLLNARGLSETLFLGSDTMRGRIGSLAPGAQFLRRERFSKLSWTGPRKLSRMPPRSAVVGFSAEDVYAIAELIRRQKGGAAVVMGALSPRTRNAQVALYQNGDVDHLVATDAIGMGLNLDIAHVAFAGTVKFDGRRHRALAPAELAQIAGRAGRYTADGTFGVTGEAEPLDPEVVEAIESHRFPPLRRLQWRSSRLDFGSTEALVASLEAPSEHPDLARAREADDVATLKALMEVGDVAGKVRDARDVRLLWDVCQLPDFRKVSASEHARLCARLHGFLHGGGRVPTDWLAGQITRIDRTEGDIDALSKRLAFIRTWTYVAQRRGWVDDADHWRGETRAVEDRLSDALHARLTQRFVDRRTSVLMRRLKQRETLVAKVSDNGEVTIDDQFIGRLDGFRFRLDPAADPDAAKTLRAAGVAALAPALSLRADRFYNAPDPEIDVTEQGGLMWGEHAVGRLVAGADALSPQVTPFVDEDAAPEIAEKVRRRLGHWIDRKVAALFAPLIAMRDDEALTGMARGIAFRLVEGMGVLPRPAVADDVKALDQDGRSSLRKHGVRFGQHTLFQPLMLKPAPTRLRLVLWGLKEGLDEIPSPPPPGLVTVPALPGAPAGYYPLAGYRLAGDRAVRIDMLERLADLIRAFDPRAGFEATPEMLSITGLGLDQFAKLMQGLGYVATPGVRPKRRPAPEAAVPPDAAADAGAAAEPASGPVVEAEAAGAAGPAEAEAAAAESVAEEPEEAAVEAAEAVEPEAAAGEVAGDVPAVEVDAEEAEAVVPEGQAAVGAGEGDVAVEAAETVEPEEAAEVAGDVPAVEVAAEEAGAAVPEGPAAGEGAEAAPAAVGAGEGDAAGEGGETEAFYTFVRAPRRRPERPHGGERRGGGEGQKARDGEGPRGPKRREGERNARPPRRDEEERKKRGGKGRPDEGGERERGPKPAAAARPPRPEKPIDPDNPFAALMALKLRG